MSAANSHAVAANRPACYTTGDTRRRRNRHAPGRTAAGRAGCSGENVSDGRRTDALIGARLGSSVVLRPLGYGGMSVVYLAQQDRPRRQVAIKVLRPHSTGADPAAWPLFLERFRREADAAAALEHGNIVPIFEFGEQSALAYIVMPYLPDGSLAGLVEREGPLPAAQVAGYIEQAAAALDYAHAHGIIHRDVKPSNLLLHSDGRLLLADFGIARALGQGEIPTPSMPLLDDAQLTQAGAVMGTPDYMAPEQVRGEAVSPATDIYALGVVAYHLLAGQTPFEGDHPNMVLVRQINEDLPPLRALIPGLPTEVEKAIRWAVAKDPAERPPSAGAFARALRTAGRAPAVTSARAARTLGDTRSSRSLIAPVHSLPSRSTASHTLSATRDDAPTVLDGAAGYRDRPDDGSGAPPVWPGALPPPATGPTPRQRRNLALYAIFAVVIVSALVLGLLFAVSASRNLFQRQPGYTAGAGNTPVTATATATTQPSPSATPLPANWLSVSATDITLTCFKSRSRTFVLTNKGPDDVSWHVELQYQSPNKPLVSVNPNRGQLDAGDSITIKVSNNAFASTQEGVIVFVPDDGAAGQGPRVNYTAKPCI